MGVTYIMLNRYANHKLSQYYVIRRYLDVDLTLFEHYGRQKDVKKTLCANWENDLCINFEGDTANNV